MASNHNITKEGENRSELLVKTFYRLVNAVMSKTDDPEDELRSIMADDINGFGTGKHEVFNSRDDFMERIFKFFHKQLPSESHLDFLNPQIAILDTIGIVHGPYEIIYTLDGNEIRFYGRRTAIFRWDDDRWRAIHMHVSEPSAHLTEGESWPVRALKAQNEELKKQVESQTEKLSKSLSDLQATQQQLILSAKMASLGELTAGIAHEIQNPLNFVNNFSEVNRELLAEMKDEIDKGNLDEVKVIANGVMDNEEKINLHGKRADAIVKGMLQHSRSSSGVKEPTDINKLAEEYLRLAYHGLRAKDKSFNATIKTDFDDSISNINIIPQDIGRVILNLLTNAFYAASLPSNRVPPSASAVAQGGFSDADRKDNPTVWVNTKKVGNQVLISVRDNGPGISQKLLDKIFQPFFTTKPTGQGTGLGLSLSYDIVKAHGGELKVETKENEGSEFIIQIPTN